MAAGALAREGVSVEVVDPRTLAPLDLDTIFEVHRESFRKAVRAGVRIAMGTDARTRSIGTAPMPRSWA